MGGFFGVAAKESCVFDLFLEQIITLIWEPDGREWQFTTGKRVMTGQSIILRMRLFGQNLIKISTV